MSLYGNLTGLPRAGLRDAENVVDRADHLVRAGHIGRADRRDLHAVLFAVILRLPLVEDLVHRVLHVAVLEIVFVDDALAIKFLLAADRHRTGIDDPVAPGEARRLEAVVHAEDVQLERDARRQVAADVIGEVDHPVGLHRRHRGHHVVELADIAAQHPHLGQLAEIGGLRVDVHDHGLLALLRQKRDQPPADKPGAADDQRRHVRFSPFAKRRGGIIGESVVPPRAAAQPSAP